MMTELNRMFRVVGLWILLFGVLLSLDGCNTGGGLPQQLEPTKSLMDGEKETDRPAPNSETAK